MSVATNVAEKRGLLATGGLIGAVLASTCCIAPLVFVTLGVSGAWIGNLTALAPYQWLFLTVSVGFLGAGFWAVYFRRTAACSAGGYCATPTADRVVKIALWAGTVLIAAAVAANVLTPLFV
ncbi:MAG TPA: mercuric transporter MerT family protein [Gammaproteobacteria bacterium]|jgi:mercuric ion transport protein